MPTPNPTPTKVAELAEQIASHVAAEYDDDPHLDSMIVELRAAVAYANPEPGEDEKNKMRAAEGAQSLLNILVYLDTIDVESYEPLASLVDEIRGIALTFPPVAPVPQSDGANREQVAAAMRAHYIDTSHKDPDNNYDCICGEWREGNDEDWDDHLAEVVLAALPSGSVQPKEQKL